MTEKKSKTKKRHLSKDDILTAYMTYVLTNERTPKSVYKFCNENNFTESEFYSYFGSFEGLQKEVWNGFFDHSMQLAHKDKSYPDFSNKEKMLTFFYTFFEILTANRSYVLFSLQMHSASMKNLTQLQGLRGRLKEFAAGLIEDGNADKQINFLKKPVSIFSEGAWLQTLFLLKYWKEDNSPSFEKTDVAIEKSVRAIFDVFETTPLESVVDFGKFLWKNKMN